METLQTIVAAISKVATAISTAANATGTLVVLALVAVVNYDIVARGVFNQPFHGAVELGHRIQHIGLRLRRKDTLE